MFGGDWEQYSLERTTELLATRHFAGSLLITVAPARFDGLSQQSCFDYLLRPGLTLRHLSALLESVAAQLSDEPHASALLSPSTPLVLLGFSKAALVLGSACAELALLFCAESGAPMSPPALSLEKLLDWEAEGAGHLLPPHEATLRITRAAQPASLVLDHRSEVASFSRRLTGAFLLSDPIACRAQPTAGLYRRV